MSERKRAGTQRRSENQEESWKGEPFMRQRKRKIWHLNGLPTTRFQAILEIKSIVSNNLIYLLMYNNTNK